MLKPFKNNEYPFFQKNSIALEQFTIDVTSEDSSIFTIILSISKPPHPVPPHPTLDLGVQDVEVQDAEQIGWLNKAMESYLSFEWRNIINFLDKK